MIKVSNITFVIWVMFSFVSSFVVCLFRFLSRPY